MQDDDQDRPDKSSLGTKDLDPMSIYELEDYIDDLQAEIERTRQEIEKKKAHKEAASSIFKT